ncbi:MAG TPA: DUF6104 family protein [Actinomycetota bacterium]|nr:DUF6104 family protein [Actinomycetota bacterium]
MADEDAGIETLRAARGDEQITFGDVCDHLIDYVGQRPQEADAVDRLARFMARVENEDHDHSDSSQGSDATTRA